MTSRAWSLSLVLGFVVGGCAGDGVDDPQPGACPMAETNADAGALTAPYAQRCNVPGSSGARKWYRIAAQLPGTEDWVQVELYDQTGAFAGGPVAPGTYPVDTDVATCGVCLRALGNKGAGDQAEYFGTGGMVTVGTLGAEGSEVTVSFTGATFEQINPSSREPVDGGCMTEVAGASLTGTLDDHFGGGGGGGGGGSGGGGQCAASVGDAEPPR